MTKEEVGRPVEEIIPAVTEVLQALTFPVSMHWANNTFEYIRPVHTLTVLLDEQAFDLDFLDIKSSRTSRGHRFLGQETEIASADSYEDDLRAQFVIASPLERGDMIVEQIRALEEEHGVSIEIDENLFNEVLNLVEYPTAFLGNFDAKYLEVPEEVLVTSMKEHQRYFVVRDSQGKLCRTSSLSATEMQSIWKMSSREMRKSWWLVWKMGNSSGGKTKSWLLLTWLKS